MAEQPGDNLRMALASMDWSARRAVLVAIHNRIKDEAPTASDPFGKVLEAVYYDIYAMEDLEQAQRDEIDEMGIMFRVVEEETPPEQ